MRVMIVNKFCIWCEVGDEDTNDGYLFIHKHCASELMDVGEDIKYIKDYILRNEEFVKKWKTTERALGLR